MNLSENIKFLVAIHAGCAIETEIKKVGEDVVVNYKTKNKVRFIPNDSLGEDSITVQEETPDGVRTVILKNNSIYVR